MESTRSRDTKAPSAWTTFFLTQSAEHAQLNNGPYAHSDTEYWWVLSCQL